MTFHLLCCCKFRSLTNKLFGHEIYEKHKIMKDKTKRFFESLDWFDIVSSIQNLRYDIERLKIESKYIVHNREVASSNRV